MSLPDDPNEIHLITTLTLLWDHFTPNIRTSLHTYISGSQVAEENMLRDIIMSLKTISTTSKKFEKFVTMLDTFIDNIDTNIDNIDTD